MVMMARYVKLEGRDELMKSSSWVLVHYIHGVLVKGIIKGIPYSESIARVT